MSARRVIIRSMPEVLDSTAVLVAERLADLEHVRSVCLIGSAARGEVGPGSDIDLLAVVDARTHVEDVRRQIIRQAGNRRVQTKVLAEDRLAEILTGRSSFAVHVLREAVVVHDDGRRFERLRSQHSRDAPIRADPDRLRRRLELYHELSWCQGQFLYCLADCYSVGRAAAYVLLGRQRIFEFCGPKALARLADERPDLEDAARLIANLRPFFVLAHRDVQEPLPHRYRECRPEAEAAVRAASELIDALDAGAAR